MWLSVVAVPVAAEPKTITRAGRATVVSRATIVSRSSDFASMIRIIPSAEQGGARERPTQSILVDAKEPEMIVKWLLDDDEFDPREPEHLELTRVAAVVSAVPRPTLRPAGRST